MRQPIHLHVTTIQPYRGRHWAPDEDESPDATADTDSQTATLATLLEDAPDEDESTPRKRKLFGLRGGKSR